MRVPDSSMIECLTNIRHGYFLLFIFIPSMELYCWPFHNPRNKSYRKVSFLKTAHFYSRLRNKQTFTNAKNSSWIRTITAIRFKWDAKWYRWTIWTGWPLPLKFDNESWKNKDDVERTIKENKMGRTIKGRKE